MNGHITGEHPIVAELRMPARYRRALAIGILLLAAAAVGAVLLAIGPVRHAAKVADQRQADGRRTEQELACRNNIGNVYVAWQGQLLVDQSKGLVASFVGADDDERAAVVDAVTRDQDALIAITPIKAEAVDVCSGDPNYALPANLQLPKEQP